MEGFNLNNFNYKLNRLILIHWYHKYYRTKQTGVTGSEVNC